MKKLIKESVIKRDIINYLNILPYCEAFTIHTTGMWDPNKKIYRTTTCRKGTPDILACYKGNFLAIEVKSNSGKLRKEQEQVLNDIRIKGLGFAIVARSVNDVINIIEYIDKSNKDDT